MPKDFDTTTTNKRHKKKIQSLLPISLFFITGLLGVVAGWILRYEYTYALAVYPTVQINDISFNKFSQQQVQSYWKEQSVPFQNTEFVFKYEDRIATISGSEIALGYDADLAAIQAMSVGRSGHMLADLKNRYSNKPINLTAYFRWDADSLVQKLQPLKDSLAIPEENALFSIKDMKVTEFKPSKPGRSMDIAETIKTFADSLSIIATSHTSQTIEIPIRVLVVEPQITTGNVNTFGIKERIGRGTSAFAGSIAGRIFNVQHAAMKIHGQLIAPGETFSFVKTVGDISAESGYQPAYIIKDGRTVLGDGGGVCQVSTTLFRAALNAGLPILERHAHAYRVGYYEQQNSKAGLDAAIFSPSVDLKFVNDTPGYILIQAYPDTKKLTLAFELYGTNDGRVSEILNHIVYGSIPPPEPLYQDDPTLPVGTVRQVDHEAWGASSSFQYRVTRSGQTIIDTKFQSVYRPWQAVFLRGTAQ